MRNVGTPNPVDKEQQFLDESLAWLHTATMDEALDFYHVVIEDPNCTNERVAALGRGDRFFLLTHILHRPDAIHPWLYDRCREVEATPDECIDLWARFHYKSTIITFAGGIQEILKDPDITICVFSHTKGIAKGFLEHIKAEFEQNDYLKQLYPDILYENPAKESPRWSLDRGINVKRKSNPKEGTVEAWGLVDGQPTSRHFKLRIYDDTVSEESVGTSDQIAKTTSRWELSQNLGDGDQNRRWHIGTRYNFGDTYQTLLDRKVLTPRVYPATDDGALTGTPVFMTQEAWDKKINDESTYTIACQMLQNPVAGGEQTFNPEWRRHWEVRPLTLNVYIMVDYAGSRASMGSSNTAIVAVGVDGHMNKYLLDGVCHKLSLSDRWTAVKNMRKYWLGQPGVKLVKVGYERYGAQSDIEHFEEMMRIEDHYFSIEELNWPREGPHAKDERIKRLQPDHENWRWFYPHPEEKGLTSQQRKAQEIGNTALIARNIKAIDENKKVYDVYQKFVTNEYTFFPNTTYKDFFDAMSRIYDMEISPPVIINENETMPEYEEDF